MDLLEPRKMDLVNRLRFATVDFGKTETTPEVVFKSLVPNGHSDSNGKEEKMK
jgi:hypothetical protein